MADYYTNFSFIMELPGPDARKAALELAEAISESNGETPLPSALVEAAEDWHFEVDASDDCGLWLHSGNGGVDAVCAFVQHLLKTYLPEGHLGFEWSHDCSKPRTDAYGGGAAFITAEGIHFTSTANWLSEQFAQHLATKQPMSSLGDSKQ